MEKTISDLPADSRSDIGKMVPNVERISPETADTAAPEVPIDYDTDIEKATPEKAMDPSTSHESTTPEIPPDYPMDVENTTHDSAQDSGSGLVVVNVDSAEFSGDTPVLVTTNIDEIEDQPTPTQLSDHVVIIEVN